jgi:hypothetical protein
LDALDNIGNITSTKLAVHRRFPFNEQLRDKFYRDGNKKDEDNNRKKRKKGIEKENEQKRFDITAPKFKEGTPLTRDDLLMLLHQIQEKGKHSPVKTTKPALLEQMQRRYDRVVEYLDPTAKKQRSLVTTDDATTGLDMLSNFMLAEEENEIMCGTTIHTTSSSTNAITNSGMGSNDIVEPPGAVMLFLPCL